MQIRNILLCCIILLTMGSATYAYDESYESAIILYRSGEYKQAIPYLESYVERKPDPAAYYMLGYFHYQLRNFDRSKEYFDQAYLIDPDFSSDRVPAHAGLSREDQDLIHEVLDLSGAKKQMESYADMLSSALPQFRAGMSDRKQNNDIHIILRDSYKINKIYPLVVSTLSARFNSKFMHAVIQWFKSPLGKKTVGFEVAANMPEMMNRPNLFYDEYDRMPEGRKRQIRSLEEALRATELNVDIISGSLFSMLKGMQVTMQGSSKMNSEQIDHLVSKVRGVSREQLTRDLLVTLAYTYRSLTDEELDDVLRFYRSLEGRWFNDISIEAISCAIGKASREVGEKMGAALLSKKVMM